MVCLPACSGVSFSHYNTTFLATLVVLILESSQLTSLGFILDGVHVVVVTIFSVLLAFQASWETYRGMAMNATAVCVIYPSFLLSTFGPRSQNCGGQNSVGGVWASIREPPSLTSTVFSSALYTKVSPTLLFLLRFYLCYISHNVCFGHWVDCAPVHRR